MTSVEQLADSLLTSERRYWQGIAARRKLGAAQRRRLDAVEVEIERRGLDADQGG